MSKLPCGTPNGAVFNSNILDYLNFLVNHNDNMRKKELNFTKEEFIDYYKTHSKEDTKEHFNIGSHIIYKLIKEFGYKKTSEDRKATLITTKIKKYGSIDSYNNKMVTNVKATKLERHGDENYNNREKFTDTMINTYGCEHALQNKNFKGKAELTCLSKYGETNYKKTEEGKERYKQSMLDKYGVDNYFKTDEFKEDLKEYNLSTYGVEHYFQSDDCKEKTEKFIEEHYKSKKDYYEDIYSKAKQTCLDRYGDENYNNRYKNAQTCLSKYGVDNYAKTRDYAVKCSNTRANSIAKDGTKLDSSWEVIFYNYCLDKGYNIERAIPITYIYKDKEHTTLIDFKVNGQLYEVKGNHLFEGCYEDNPKFNGVPIEEKLKVYKDNDIILVMDLSSVNKEDYSGITLIDIYDLYL